MDANRKKELREAYLNRQVEMGIVAIRCTATGQDFLECSKDTRATVNSLRSRIINHYHPNKELMALMDRYPPEKFEVLVLRVLEYEDPTRDYSDELELLREECLEQDPKAQRLWK